MYLLGYYNPSHCYPSKVVPIINKASKIFAIYRTNNDIEYREIPDSMTYNKLSDRQMLEYDKINILESHLFAFNPDDILFYGSDKELLEIIQESKKYINYNPFSLLNLTLLYGNEFLVQYAFRKCVTELIGVDMVFANNWYTENYKLALKKIDLPQSIEQYINNFNIVKIGCAIDKLDLITELNNHINSNKALFSEYKTQLVTYAYNNSELVQAFQNNKLDILIPESDDFYKEHEDEKLDKEKYHSLCSSRIVLIINLTKIGRDVNINEAFQLFFENLLFNQNFSFIRPRSNTQYGMLIDSFILENIGKYKENINSENIESIIKQIENKVKRYFNSDQELMDYLKSDNNLEIDAFFIKKSFINEFRDIILDDYISIEIELDDRYNLDTGLYIVNSNLNFLDIPNRYQELMFENEYLIKSNNIEFPISEAHAKLQLELLSKYFDFGYKTLQRPLSINIVVDSSSSMQGEKIDSVKDAIRTFIALLNSERGDKLGIIEFNDSAKVLSPIEYIANNEDNLFKILRELSSHGWTALLDAINLSIDSHFDLVDDTIKIIIVLTDGHENSSRTTLDELNRKIMKFKNDIFLFGFAFGQDADLKLLKELSQLTGGYTHEGTISNIKQLFSYIAKQI